MKVDIHLRQTSQSFTYDAINAYQKGDLYCVLLRREDGIIVHKYPLSTVFRIIEEYDTKS